MPESHRVVDGKVYVYRRARSPFWQCAVFLDGRNLRRSTGRDNLALAMDYARDWYEDQLAEARMVRKGLLPSGEPPVKGAPRPPRAKAGEKLFRDAAAAFLQEFKVLTEGERNEAYVASKDAVLRRYLLPFFGAYPVAAVTAGLVQDYRLSRNRPPEPEKVDGRRAQRRRTEEPKPWRRPARSTVGKEIVCLRQVLRLANRRGWIDALPDLSPPYRASTKVSHRAWFSPEEYERLYTTTREWAATPPKPQWREIYERLHDYVLFMGNTGLRPDEASLLQYRDVSIVTDADTGKRILEIEVRGKRGVGYCKSMPGAVHPFERMRERSGGAPKDLIFGKARVEPLNRVLEALDLKFDREGQRRTAYSLRHTYICLRLMQGADIYQIAKNCRTSVEMIEKFYASHIKNTLDASAINIRKPTKPRKAPSARTAPANAKAPPRRTPPSRRTTS